MLSDLPGYQRPRIYYKELKAELRKLSVQPPTRLSTQTGNSHADFPTPSSDRGRFLRFRSERQVVRGDTAAADSPSFSLSQNHHQAPRASSENPSSVSFNDAQSHRYAYQNPQGSASGFVLRRPPTRARASRSRPSPQASAPMWTARKARRPRSTRWSSERKVDTPGTH
ncbi:hypothetical protein NW762_007359 [Fusarium torreyae]|uniref:Uncharacterized protein n=1 Tax=Fusarium torreyae TaxID=1237075 RepID=A0A9W8S1L3_9HYPO|nr:hypothetical protein NW762_007359 [Fusarium torreyae]